MTPQPWDELEVLATDRRSSSSPNHQCWSARSLLRMQQGVLVDATRQSQELGLHPPLVGISVSPILLPPGAGYFLSILIAQPIQMRRSPKKAYLI